MKFSRGLALAGSAAATWFFLGACGSDAGGPSDAGAPSEGGDLTEGGDPIGFGEGGTPGTNIPTCDKGCPMGTVCNHGLCLPPQMACTSNAGCQYDTYCDATGVCVPYGTKPDNKNNDGMCKLAFPPGSFAATVKCEFSKPPAGDPFPNHVDVQATPIVVNFNAILAPPDQTPRPAGPPSIVAPFTAPVAGSYTENLGIVRILRGTDCTLEANLGGVDLDGDGIIDWVNSSSSVAVADLDNDKIADVVVYLADNTTAAFTLKNKVWAPLWPKKKATLADGTTLFVSTLPGSWGSPSIHDLDDDGIPEIIREGYVIDGLTGKLKAGLPPGYATYYVGIPAVVANLDGDAKIEMTNGAHVWEFSGGAWVDDPAYLQTTTSGPGWAAVADFNPYDGKKTPETPVTTAGMLTIFNLDHTVFMNMTVPVPGGGGGPPTVADYDGDGLPEVGLAGANYYTVFDPDCQGTPRPGGKCADRTHCDFVAGGACPDRILWSRKSQDLSSNITGSSVFDFEADGKAEVVYADECFARVYSGSDGTVLFSQYHSSCTWLENPVVADVDGDFRAELVVPSNTACGPVGVGIDCAGALDPSGVDSLFTGIVCNANADCVSGSCVAGYCRCTATAQCCPDKDDAKCLEFGYKCVAPPAATPGAGNTCRAARPHGVQGIRVYKDGRDRWVRSRTIWNQHAYAVTHVSENGIVPKSSAWASNWTTPQLNNFRQNVPGTGDGKDIGDLTAQAGPFFTCTGTSARMAVPVCNRGTAPVAAGVVVGFYVGGAKVCSTKTNGPLDPGRCETVSCTWSAPPATEAMAVDVGVVANDGNGVPVCDTLNNKGLVERVFCAGPR